MNRYNIFNQVHKALRAALYETGQSLLQTDFISKSEAATTFTQIEEVIELFNNHAHTEDHIVLPELKDYEPGVVLAFAEEHEKDGDLARRLTELMFVYRQSTTDRTRIETGNLINISYIRLTVFNLEHMAREEEVVNRLLWRYYSDEQLQQLTQKIIGQVSPAIMAKYSRWLMRSLNNSELIGWLKEVRANAPDFISLNLMNIAKNELTAQRWLEVSEQVGHAVAVA